MNSMFTLAAPCLNKNKQVKMMEYLVAVEIVKDECQSCLKALEVDDTYELFVTAELQEIFADLLSDELKDGLICSHCNDHILAFHQFKKDIQACRLAIATNDIFENPIEPKVVEPTSKSKPTNIPKIFCPVCNKEITARALPQHLKTHDLVRPRNFMCEICSKRYLNKHELVVHRRGHLNIRPFTCDLCLARPFTSKNNLAKHIHSQHLNRRRPIHFTVVCPLCEKLFPFQSKMMEHYKKAHPGGFDDGVRVNRATNHFHCDKCGLEFLTKYRFDHHVCMAAARDVSAVNRCPVCSLKSESRLDLIKHLHEHGEKLCNNKWRCKVCNAIVQEKIAVHVENTHSSNEFLSCNLCNKQLKNRKSLRQHMLLSHENGYEKRKQKRKAKKRIEVIE